MSYIKRMAIELEDGVILVEGAAVNSITIETNVDRPVLVILEMYAEDARWGNVRPSNQKNITPSPKQLTTSQKQLPEAICTCADSYGICAVHQIK